MTSTSIGRGPASGGNENHDGDPSNKTLGEKVGQETPAGTESAAGEAGISRTPQGSSVRENGGSHPEEGEIP